VFRKLTLAAAAGAGYVLGAKAGKERYNQIEAKFREIAGMPAVQNATATVKDTASSVADTAKTTVNEKVGSGSSSDTGTGTGFPPPAATTASDTDVVVVDLGTGADTGATSSSGGARPSDTI
jgi:hypothetical protein